MKKFLRFFTIINKYSKWILYDHEIIVFDTIWFTDFGIIPTVCFYYIDELNNETIPHLRKMSRNKFLLNAKKL